MNYGIRTSFFFFLILCPLIILSNDVNFPLPFHISIRNNNQQRIFQSVGNSPGCDTLTEQQHNCQLNNAGTDGITIENDNNHTTVQRTQNGNKIAKDAHLAALPTTSAAAMQPAGSKIQRFTQFIKTYAAKLTNLHTVFYIAGGAALGYATLLTAAVIQGKKVSNKNSWAQWKKELSISQLKAHEKQIAQELFAAVQKKYVVTRATRNANFLAPLVQFFNDIQADVTACQRFISLVNTMQTYKFDAILPDQSYLVEKAHKKIKRLTFLKELITSWVGEYKVELP